MPSEITEIKSKLITVDDKTIFDSMLASNLISQKSVVFILDTQQIWTHGTFIGGTNAGNYIVFGTATTQYVPVTVNGDTTNTYNLSLSSHSHQMITGTKNSVSYTLDVTTGGSLGGPLAFKYDAITSGQIKTLIDISNGRTVQNNKGFEGVGETYLETIVNGSAQNIYREILASDGGFAFYDVNNRYRTYDPNFFTYNDYPILTSQNIKDYAADLTLSNVVHGSAAYINIIADPNATNLDEMGGIAQFTQYILQPLHINGISYNGGDDPVWIDAIGIDYGGTGKTLIPRTAHSATGNDYPDSPIDHEVGREGMTDAWFKASDLTVGADLNILPYLNAVNQNGTISSKFKSVGIPNLEGAERYALINTAQGLSWVNLGVFLESAAAMVFKGTVNCSTLQELQEAQLADPENVGLQQIQGLEVPWFDVEIGWTYVVTDREFELHCLENTYGTYGKVEVGDLLICMERGYIDSTGTEHICQWAVVQNKVSDTITYGTPTIKELPQALNGTSQDYVAMSMGKNPTQIKYHNNFYIDDRGVMHGKFEGQIIQPVNNDNYAGFAQNELLLTFTSAQGEDITGLCQRLQGNNDAVRISSTYGNLIYDSLNPYWAEDAGSNSIYYIYEISGNNATLQSFSNLNSMSTGQTKQISIISLGKNDGQYYAQTNNILTIGHNYDNITDYKVTLNFLEQIGGQINRGTYHNNVKTQLANFVKANIASRTTFTLTKIIGGFTITSSDNYYLSKFEQFSEPSLLTGGTYYNPIYIDNDSITHTTQIYLYNLMNQYTDTIPAWGDSARNPNYDNLRIAYRDEQGSIVAYGKNLVIPVNGAKRFLKAADSSNITGAILQWSNSTGNTINNYQLFGSTNKKLYYRGQNGSVWGDWAQLVTTNDLPELVTAFDDSVTDSQIPSAKLVYDTITADELVTAQALNAHHTQIENLWEAINNIGTIQGQEGLSIFTSTGSSLSTSTTSIIFASINIPAGRELKVGDLILSTSNGYLYRVTSIIEDPRGNSAAVTYIASLKGTSVYTGTGITGTNGTATVFSGSGVTYAKVNDLYINPSTGNVYQCYTEGNASTATWKYGGCLKGNAGTRGSNYFTGTGVTGTNTTAATFSGSGVTSAIANDLYLNTDTGNLYQCVAGGNASTATWKYVMNIKGPQGSSTNTTLSWTDISSTSTPTNLALYGTNASIYYTSTASFSSSTSRLYIKRPDSTGTSSIELKVGPSTSEKRGVIEVNQQGELVLWSPSGSSTPIGSGIKLSAEGTDYLYIKNFGTEAAPDKYAKMNGDWQVHGTLLNRANNFKTYKPIEFYAQSGSNWVNNVTLDQGTVTTARTFNFPNTGGTLATEELVNYGNYSHPVILWSGYLYRNLNTGTNIYSAAAASAGPCTLAINGKINDSVELTISINNGKTINLSSVQVSVRSLGYLSSSSTSTLSEILPNASYTLPQKYMLGPLMSYYSGNKIYVSGLRRGDDTNCEWYNDALYSTASYTSGTNQHKYVLKSFYITVFGYIS